MIQQSSFFNRYAHNLSSPKKPDTVLKNHPQIPIIQDILNRQQHHHLVLASNADEKIHFALAETIASHLANANTSIIYFDVLQLLLTQIDQGQLERSFHQLAEDAQLRHKKIIFILNQADPLFPDHAHPLAILKSYLPMSNWRILAFANPLQTEKLSYLKNLMTFLPLHEPGKLEQIALLKSYRQSLESFHQVSMSEETFVGAFSLAEHYLAGESTFAKALELLDSAASRARMTEKSLEMTRPIVTGDLLTQVVSSWTHIPLTHLQHNKFQTAKFLESLRKQIFGQDPAINHAASLLQNACTKLVKASGPLCSFLFAGSADTGKTATAYAIAEHLFGHRDALLHVNLSHTAYTSLADIKITPKKGQTHCLSLLEAIQQTPFAVVLIENIDQVKTEVVDLFHDIFHLGFVIDKNRKYDFQHAIFIMTTQLAAENMQKLSSSASQQESSKNLDLMQLILNPGIADQIPHTAHQYSPQELCDELYPKLATHFSPLLLQKINVVPFVNLDYAAVEKIIRTKIKTLGRRIEANFGIDVTVAPEVIRFLTHEAFWRRQHNKSIEKTLELYLYSCVSHEILLFAEDKNRPRQLVVQLNDSGQMLRCEVGKMKEGIFV